MKARLVDRIAYAESYMDFVKSTYGTNGDLDAERDAELDMTMARADIEKARELLDVMERRRASSDLGARDFRELNGPQGSSKANSYSEWALSFKK